MNIILAILIAIYVNTIKFSLIYNNFFYRVIFFFHENVISEIEKSKKLISAKAVEYSISYP